MCSIKAQAAKANVTYSQNYDLLINNKEIELVKHINEFRATIIDGAVNRAPHKIANYVQRLAQLFHSFYARITMANALSLIGVSAPEKM